MLTLLALLCSICVILGRADPDPDPGPARAEETPGPRFADWTEADDQSAAG